MNDNKFISNKTKTMVQNKRLFTIIFLHYFSQAAISIKICNLFVYVVLSCAILEEDNYIVNLYIVLSCLIK